MALQVPAGREGFAREVHLRFRALVMSHVIDVFSVTDFDAWCTKFVSEEDQYLRAHLLSALIVRTPRMLRSSHRQILDVILPSLLRSSGLAPPTLCELHRLLSSRDAPLDVRFMPLDGLRLDRRPGNSGDGVLRQFAIETSINDSYLVRADHDLTWNHPPRLLVILDDFLGSGKQLRTFYKRYPFNALPVTTKCVYVPLLATEDGISRAAPECPRIEMQPVERLGLEAGFFREDPAKKDIWHRDGENTVADVKAHYSQILINSGVQPHTKFGMDLTVILPDRPPNNTLKAFWTNGGSWNPLLPR